MKQIRCLAFVLIVIVVILSAGCGPTETPAPAEPEAPAEEEVHEGQKLVASRCITCHTIGVVENKRYDRDGWQSIVDQMIINGTQLDATEMEQVVDYLAINFPKE